MAYARWTLWNRFPNAGQYALTETRKDEWELAKDLLKNPYIGVEQPDNGGGGGGAGDISYLSADGAIDIPWLRFPPEIGECGFPEVYWPKHGGFGGCCK